MVTQPTLINTGGYGTPTDVFDAIDAKYKEVIRTPYKNIPIFPYSCNISYGFNPDSDTPIEYNADPVYITIFGESEVVGIPGNMSDLVTMLRNLGIGIFDINDDLSGFYYSGFFDVGAITQNEMVVFSTDTPEELDIIPSQVDINNYFAFKIKYATDTEESDDQWLIGGNNLSAKGLIGSTNNQHVSIIVNSDETLSFRVNTSWHRMGKLFSIEYSDNNTSWGSGAMTDWTTGENNTGIGADALSALQSGDDNTGVGKNVLHKIITSGRNTGMGYNAGSDLELGDSNVFYGRNSGNNLVNGNAMTFLGSDTKAALDGIHSGVVLGYNAEVTASNQFAIGAVPDGDGYGAITHVVTYYSSSKTHTDYYVETSPVAGLVAQRGSIAYLNDGSTGSAWLKVGATSTAWEMIQTTSGLAIPNQEIVFGNGSTVVSSTNLKFNVSNGRFTVNGEIYAGLSTGLTTDSVMKLSNSVATSFFYLSTASPESVITASRGSIAFVNTGSLGQLWVKTSTAGNTGWSAALTTSTGALMGLSNLASVSINTSLIPQTSIDLGAAATPWRDLYLYGSGTFGSHSMRFTGTPTSNRVYTFPDITDTIVTLTATQTLSNKRVTKRVGTVVSSATPTINTDSVDMFTITALATAITSFTTNLSGTPTAGQLLRIRIKDDGTARAITWGASFVTRIGTLPTTTVISKYLYVLFEWNEVALVWDCMATGQEA